MVVGRLLLIRDGHELYFSNPAQFCVVPTLVFPRGAHIVGTLCFPSRPPLCICPLMGCSMIPSPTSPVASHSLAAVHTSFLHFLQGPPALMRRQGMEGHGFASEWGLLEEMVEGSMHCCWQVAGHWGQWVREAHGIRGTPMIRRIILHWTGPNTVHAHLYFRYLKACNNHKACHQCHLYLVPNIKYKAMYNFLMGFELIVTM